MYENGDFMTKYKIVFVDIDDTLNPSNGEVSPHTKDIMTKLKEKNIPVVINSGRSAQYAITKSMEANLSNYVISSNGAEVYDYHNDVIIFEQSIPPKTIKAVYKFCEKHDLTLILNSVKERFININNYNYNSEPATYFEDIDEVINNHNINQLIVLSKNFDRMLVIPNMFKEEFPNLKVVHSSLALIEDHRVKGKEYYHDLVLENTAKSTGIVELLDYLNIDPEEAIAIGNGYDDICMTDVVGTSVAMGNAVARMKEASTYITKEVTEDGVADILEKLCLESSDLNERETKK